MRPVSLLLCAISAALPLMCGCATGNGWVPFASGSDRPEKMVEVELAADRTSPWGRKPAAAEETEPEPKSNWFTGMFGKKKKVEKRLPLNLNTNQAPRTASKSGSSRATSTAQDQTTRAYIDRELRDCTPEERTALYQQLQGQDPQMVQQIVKVRKMSRAVERQQRAAANQEEAAHPSYRPRENQSPPADPQEDAAEYSEASPRPADQPAGYHNAGMGSLDPWRGNGNSPQFADPNGAPAPSHGVPGDVVAQTQYADQYGRAFSGAGSRLAAGRSPGSGAGNGLPLPAAPAGYTRSWSLDPEQGGMPQANRSLSTPQFQGGSAWQNNPQSPPYGNLSNQATAQGVPAAPPGWGQPPAAQAPALGQAAPWDPRKMGGMPASNRSTTGIQPRIDLGNLVPGQFNPAAYGQGPPGPGQSSPPSYDPRTALSGGPNPASVNAGIQPTNFHAQPGQGQGAATGSPSAWNDGAVASQPVPASYVAVQRASWQAGLQQIISVAETQTSQLKTGTTDAERQGYIESHVYLRMLYLMSGQQERALQAIPGLDPADQEFWQQTFWGMSNYFDSRGMPRPSDRASQAAAQLTAAVQHLQAKANLELRNVSFCQKIVSFGNYERFPREEFTPGQQVLLYGEVLNFLSEATAAGQYRTVLKSAVEFYKPGPQGELLDRIEFNSTEDLCRSFRRDYFHSYEFAIPAKLSMGPHVLKLTVEDQLSHRLATYTLNFTVH